MMNGATELSVGTIAMPPISMRSIIREDAPHFIRAQLNDIDTQMAALQNARRAVLVGYAVAKGWDGITNTIHYNEGTGVFTVTPIPSDAVIQASAQS